MYRPARRASFRIWLAWISVVGLGVRVAYVELFASRIQVGLDTTWYQLISATISSGAGFVDPGKYFGERIAVATAFRPPLYPAFLAGIAKTVDGSIHTYRLAGSVAGVVTIVLVGHLGRRVGGTAVGLCAAALAAVYPIFLAIDAAVMSETLYVPLVTGCVLAVYAAIDRPSVGRWIAVGALTGAAILTRSDAVALIVLLVVPAALVAPNVPLPRRIQCAAASLVTCALVVVPWAIRNEQRLGVGTVATLQSGTTIAGANCADTYHGELLGSWSFTCTTRPGQDRMGEVALNRQLREDGQRYLTRHVGRLGVVVPVRILRQWGLYDPMGQVRLEAIESRNRTWQVVSWFTFLPIAALAACGFVILRRRRVRLHPMLAIVVGVTVSAAAVYGNQRLRAGVEPVLVVAAAVAIVHLAGRRRGLSRPAPSASS